MTNMTHDDDTPAPDSNSADVTDRPRVIRERRRVTAPEGHTYTEPAILACPCGREVPLTTNDNECDCGRIYNAFGQELAPRHLWEPDDPYYDEDY